VAGSGSHAHSTERGEAPDDDGGDLCHRGPYCAGRKIVILDGRKTIIPARTYTAFCPACRDVIARCLGELPEAYGRLQAEIGEPVKRNSDVRTPFGPSLPLRADVDAVMHAISDVLVSWEERARDLCSLSPLDTATSRQRDATEAIRQSVTILAPRLNVLFAMTPEPMLRFDPGYGGEPDTPVLDELGGSDAGEEILRLHYRARAILGEVASRPDTLDGVPCRSCEDMALERAEPPSDPSREAMWSRCAQCHATMTLKEFREWAHWYAGWADKAGLTCKRCTYGRHDECVYRQCRHDGCAALAAA
jgi:hypothetical protein